MDKKNNMLVFNEQKQENNQLLDGKNNCIWHEATSHHPVFDYFAITAQHKCFIPNFIIKSY